MAFIANNREDRKRVNEVFKYLSNSNGPVDCKHLLRLLNEDSKKEDIREALDDYANAQAIIDLTADNTLALTISIGDKEIGLCSNSEVVSALEYHKEQIVKFLNGEPNEWE